MKPIHVGLNEHANETDRTVTANIGEIKSWMRRLLVEQIATHLNKNQNNSMAETGTD